MAIFAMFPGQGAQSIGMGKSFFDAHPLAKERFSEADEVLGFPLSNYCFEGPIEKLTETPITQPALLTVSVIAFELWKERHGIQDISVTAGHSLGEYSSLVAAGAIDFSEAVRIVHHRGAFMQEAVPVGVGSMVAILGKETDEIQSALSLFRENPENTTLQIANINSPGQVVLAGLTTEVDEFISVNSSWKMKKLQVSAPFHCSLMEPARDKLAPLLNDVTLRTPLFPVIQNFTAAPTTDPEEIRRNLISQVCGSVRWVECVTRAVKDYRVSEAIEFGTGTVLSGLSKRIDRSLPTRDVTAFEQL